MNGGATNRHRLCLLLVCCALLFLPGVKLEGSNEVALENENGRSNVNSEEQPSGQASQDGSSGGGTTTEEGTQSEEDNANESEEFTTYVSPTKEVKTNATPPLLYPRQTFGTTESPLGKNPFSKPVNETEPFVGRGFRNDVELNISSAAEAFEKLANSIVVDVKPADSSTIVRIEPTQPALAARKVSKSSVELFTYSYGEEIQPTAADLHPQHVEATPRLKTIPTPTTHTQFFSVRYVDMVEPRSVSVSQETFSIHRVTYEEKSPEESSEDTDEDADIQPTASFNEDYNTISPRANHNKEISPSRSEQYSYTSVYSYYHGQPYGVSYDAPPDMTTPRDAASANGVHNSINPTSVTRYADPASAYSDWQASANQSERRSSSSTPSLPTKPISVKPPDLRSTMNFDSIEEISTDSDANETKPIGYKPGKVPTQGDATPETPNPTGNRTDNAVGVKLYVHVTMEVTWEEFCENTDVFKTAMADMLTSKVNNRTVRPSQIVLLDDQQQCGIDDPQRESHQNHVITRREVVITVNFYVQDDEGRFDPVLTEIAGNTWNPAHLQHTTFQGKIRSVKIIHQQHAAVTNQSPVTGNSGLILAITISTIAAICLILLGILLVIVRQRQARFKYARRCRPATLHAYNLDSVCNSMKRKQQHRASKRSYINQGFEDPNAPSHPVNFAGLANFCLEEATLEEEFRTIPSVVPTIDDLPPGAEAKNRYANVIPIPETRVQLLRLDNNPLSDFINANYVRGPRGEEKYYIACQAPMESTRADFWRMVWEQQSKVIVMLTDFVEDGSKRCEEYFPLSETLDCHQLYGDFQVTLKKQDIREHCIQSYLLVKDMEHNLRREVMHFWFHKWPTRGVPDEPHNFMSFLLEVRKHAQESANAPLIVHCSPGTGRTGTYLTCDSGMREFEETRLVDIPRTVYRIRRDRAGAVQTKEQYVFIYQVLNCYAANLTGAAIKCL